MNTLDDDTPSNQITSTLLTLSTSSLLEFTIVTYLFENILFPFITANRSKSFTSTFFDKVETGGSVHTNVTFRDSIWCQYYDTNKKMNEKIYFQYLTHTRAYSILY